MNDPEVFGLIGEITEARDHLDHVKRTLRQSHDPALIAVQKQLAKLTDKYQDLWTSKYAEILKRLKDDESAAMRSAINKLRNKIAVLKNKQARLSKNFEILEEARKRESTRK